MGWTVWQKRLAFSRLKLPSPWVGLVVTVVSECVIVRKCVCVASRRCPRVCGLVVRFGGDNIVLSLQHDSPPDGKAHRSRLISLDYKPCHLSLSLSIL